MTAKPNDKRSVNNIMNSPEIKAYILEHRELFWYTPEKEKENISHELLVETILNYGDLEAVKKLFEIMGVENVAKIFWTAINTSERKRGNYHELVLNYFILYFKRHAS
jgi:hypothetical protein